MRMMLRVVVMSALALALCTAQGQTYVNLHVFSGGDGWSPLGSPTVSGSTLYGMAPYGGASDMGVAFAMNTDGTGFGTLHEFAGAPGDGQYPNGSLTLSGSTFYGTTYYGGAYGPGVVFKMNTDGSGYSHLHEFAGGAGDGQYPTGSLTLSGSTLYGMTPYGGALGLGAVFKVNTDGTGFSTLHEFAGGAGDGRYPFGDLALSGSTLYGMTGAGGTSNLGVVFKVNTDGSGYSDLHEFAGGAGDGSTPFGSLTLSGSTLYGMTQNGGLSGLGAVFKINTDGTGYSDLHEFAGGAGDGANPYGSLTLSGSTLYGMTRLGGASGYGDIFQISTDGTGYSDLHEFAGGAGDGSFPYGSLTLSGSTLYGMASGGGGSDMGVVFKLDLPVVPEPATGSLLAMGLGGLLARRRRTAA